MDRVAELVRELEPETTPPSVEAQARQREILLRSMTPHDPAVTTPRNWRARRTGWLVALAGAAAVAVGLALWVPGPSPSGRTRLHPSGTTSAVLAAVKVALAGTSDDVEKVQSTLSGATLSATSWVDLATGACRVDTSLNDQPSLTIFDERGSAIVVDYAKKEWWTRRTAGVTCEPLTPRTIAHELAAGRYAVTGHATVDGQPSLKLVATTTSSGLHPVTKLTTLWVNATTYLPIQSTSTGHLTEQKVFTWLPATATNTAVLAVTLPAGFQKVAAPPTEVQPIP